jgi:hypothetical protein
MTAASDADRVFAWHLSAYTSLAAKRSIQSASEVAASRHELLAFAEWRFHELIHGFSESFHDSWECIGSPFREAAVSSMPGRPGSAP